MEFWKKVLMYQSHSRYSENSIAWNDNYVMKTENPISHRTGWISEVSIYYKEFLGWLYGDNDTSEIDGFSLVLSGGVLIINLPFIGEYKASKVSELKDICVYLKMLTNSIRYWKAIHEELYKDKE
jgi:hypothetical protein